MGFVKTNYPQNERTAGHPFYFTDFLNEKLSSSNPLKVGYKLEYSLKFYTEPQPGFRAIKIRILSKQLTNQKAIDMKPKLNLDQSVFRNYYSSKLISVDNINKTGKLQIPSHLTDTIKNSESLSFTFNDCRGFDLSKLNLQCILEYKIGVNRNYNQDNDYGKSKGGSQYKAITVRIPMLYYQWQRFDESSKTWQGETRENTVLYEKKYNPHHKNTNDVIISETGHKLRRTVRFKGKILKIDTSTKRAQVQINYFKEYGKDIGVWFDFSDCNFNPYSLKIDDDVEYNLKGNSAKNVKLWLLPYKWIYKSKQAITSNNDDDENWKDFTYHQCKEMEQSYNINGDDDCKDVDRILNNEQVVARRITTFKSKVIFDKHVKNKCYLNLTYDRQERLGIRIPYFLKQNKHNIRHGNWVQFELQRDLKAAIWNICNVKKIKFESVFGKYYKN